MLNYTDYLMVISLPDYIVKEISRYKRASVNVIGHFEGMHRTAFITISLQTRCKPFLAQPAILKMGENIATMPPIEIGLKGFGYFNISNTEKTIYAVIEQTPQTVNWFKLLKLQMGIKVKNFVPHIPIAQNLPSPVFNKLWPNFKNREYKVTFNVNSLTILQKETFAEYAEWQVYKELFFANKLSIF